MKLQAVFAFLSQSEVELKASLTSRFMQPQFQDQNGRRRLDVKHCKLQEWNSPLKHEDLNFQEHFAILLLIFKLLFLLSPSNEVENERMPRAELALKKLNAWWRSKLFEETSSSFADFLTFCCPQPEVWKCRRAFFT